MGGIRLKSYEFRKERESAWRQLEILVDQAERKGVDSLSGADLRRLPQLYRNALSSLNVARAISLDKNLLDYLQALCQRSYFCVYGVRRHLRERRLPTSCCMPSPRRCVGIVGISPWPRPS